MDRPGTPVEAQRVACEVCLKEIPQSEAAMAEAADYVAYFCGLECYQTWKNRNGSISAGVGPNAAVQR